MGWTLAALVAHKARQVAKRAPTPPESTAHCAPQLIYATRVTAVLMDPLKTLLKVRVKDPATSVIHTAVIVQPMAPTSVTQATVTLAGLTIPPPSNAQHVRLAVHPAALLPRATLVPQVRV